MRLDPTRFYLRARGSQAPDDRALRAARLRALSHARHFPRVIVRALRGRDRARRRPSVAAHDIEPFPSRHPGRDRLAAEGGSRGQGSAGAHLGLGQDRHRRPREGPRGRGCRDPLHRRHREGDARRGREGDRRQRVHGVARGDGRPREDAAPARPRRLVDARARLRSRRAREPRRQADRPRGREPLPLRADGRARRRARRGRREHRHRGSLDGAQRSEEPRARHGGHRPRRLRGGPRGRHERSRHEPRAPSAPRREGLRPHRPRAR